MKKTFFALFAAAVLVLGFSSCGEQKSYTQILTEQTKGWVLSAATSNPAYLMTAGNSVENLMEGYLAKCELDDIITFKEGNIMTIDPSTNIEVGFGYQAVVPATWNLSTDQKTLNMQIPFFYDDTYMNYDQEIESCTILSLTSKELVLSYKFNDDESPLKGEYEFTLTYVPAK